MRFRTLCADDSQKLHLSRLTPKKNGRFTGEIGMIYFFQMNPVLSLVLNLVGNCL